MPLLRAAFVDDVVQLEFCLASNADEPPIHIGRDGQRLTVCGARVVEWVRGTPFTVEDIECEKCRAWIARHTT